MSLNTTVNRQIIVITLGISVSTEHYLCRSYNIIIPIITVIILQWMINYRISVLETK